MSVQSPNMRSLKHSSCFLLNQLTKNEGKIITEHTTAAAEAKVLPWMKVGWAKEQGENREEADEGFGAGITNDAMLSLSIQWGLWVFAVRYANVFIWRLFVCVFVCTSCSCRLKILVPWVTRAPQRWYLSFFKRRRLPALFFILLLLFAFFIFPPLLISIYINFFFK